MSLTKEQYVESFGLKCPNCEKEEDVSATQNFGVSSLQLYQVCKCFACGAEWHDVYELIGYEDLEP